MTKAKGKFILLICLVLSLVMMLVLSSCNNTEPPSNDNTGNTGSNTGSSVDSGAGGSSPDVGGGSIPDNPQHQHSYGEFVTIKEPTCTEDGLKAKSCSCGDVVSESIAATGHSEEIMPAVGSTCTETGLTEGKKCSRCGEILVAQQKTEAKGHTDEILPAVAPTCTKTGLTEGKKCSVCGEVLINQIILPQSGHTYDDNNDVNCNVCGFIRDVNCTHSNTVTLDPIAPTCTKTGLTEGKKCSACGEILLKQEVLPIAPHSYGEWITTKEPTCLEKGSKEKKCSACGDTVSEVINANGHTEEAIKAVAPTCTKTGLTEGKKCSACGEILLKQEVLPIVPHSYGEWITTKEPTCLEKGSKEKKCSACGDTVSEVINANGHAEEAIKAVEPTCTKTGLTEGKKCSACGEILLKQEVLPIAPHSYGEWITTKEPTCLEKGSKEKKCSVCGDTVSEAINANGHTEEAIKAVEPTCTKTGLSEGKKCSVCGEILLKQEVLPTKEHNYGDGICLACGELQSKGLELTLNEETSTYTISVGTCTDTKIIIPSKYKNLPVTSIDSDAFSGCESLTSIVIPNSVTSIGEYAFCDCESLTSIVIPNSVTSIGLSAFEGCESLTSIEIPNSVTSIGYYAFSRCTALEEIYFNAASMANFSSSNFVFDSAGANGDGITVTIGKDVTKIPTYLFCSSSEITSVIFEDVSVCNSIGDYAFYGCESLTSIEIPNSVTSIGYSAFEDCTALEEIYFNAASMADLSSYDDVFDSAGINGDGITVTIGKDVTKIPAYLFYSYQNSYAPKITSVIFEDVSVCKSIGEYAFYGCASLTSIEIPNSVTSIGEGAFRECTALEEIYFNVASMADLSSDAFVFDNAGINGDGITVTIGKDVTKIPAYLFSSSFENATNITSVVFEDVSVCKRIGKYAFEGCTSLTSIEIPNSVTSIGEYAFYGCTSLTSVEIPNSVTSIVEGAFYGCESIEAVYIADLGSWCNISFEDGTANPLSYAKNLYLNKDLVTNLVIPNSVTSIGDYAFYGFTALTSIEIPNSVTSIGSYAFYGCASLISIEIPNSVISIGSSAFFNCTSLTNVVIPNSVTSIGSSAFSDCTSLTNVVIPNSVTSIDSDAFYRCTSLTSIEIPNSVTSIGNYAFYRCTSLTSIVIPNSVISIGNYAFDSCTALEEIYFNAASMADLSSSNGVFNNAGTNGDGITVTIGKDVTKIPAYLFYSSSKITSVIFDDESVCNSIGDYAFSGCASLTSIEIPNSVTSIGNFAFDGCTSLKYNEYDNAYYIGSEENPYLVLIKAKDTSITSCKINESTRFIHSNAFHGCTSLTSIEIPNSVTSIGGGAFYNCKLLTGIEIPNSVTSIDDYTFYGCTALTSIVIPNSVISIGKYAFDSCTALEEIYFNAASMANLSSNNKAFNNAGINGDGITVTIGKDVTKIPAYLFCPYQNSYAPKITSVIFEDESVCNSIGNYAFSGCASLTSIEIPNGLTSIGNYAFYGCKALTSIVIPNSVTSIGNYAFYNCKLLTGIEISNGVTSIGNYAFYGCASLTSIEIPNSVTSIGNSAFYNCTALTSIVIPNSITSISDYTFYGCASLTSIVIPNSATSIGYSAFRDCTSLTSIVIPSSVTSIGTYAFYRCTALEEIYFNAASMANLSSSNGVFNNAGINGDGITVTIGKDVTKIPAYLFCPYQNSYAPKITSVIFENESVCNSIGDYAFSGCTALTSIVIPNSITSIGYYAFGDCTALEEIYFNAASMADLSSRSYVFLNAGTNGDGITVTIGKDVTKIPACLFYSSSKITSVIFEDESVCKSIGASAFYGCKALTSIVIPNSVTSIGGGAFSGCTSLMYNEYDNACYIGSEENPYLILIKAKDTSITSCKINESTKFIHYNAFRGCTSLTSIVIPNSVTSIGSSAFYGCKALTSIVIPNSVTSISDYTFYGCTSLTSIVIPNSVTIIGNYAFYNCTALTSIVIPNSVTSIGDYAFDSCTSLESVTIGDSVTSIGRDAFDDCTALEAVYITDLGSWCNISYEYSSTNPLYYAKNLYLNGELVTNLVIPDSVTSIGFSAFEGCTSLTSIVIPSSVTSIGGCAFSGCTSLTSIVIPNSITSIGYYAFEDCTALEEIYFNAASMANLSSNNNVFNNAGINGDGITVTIGKDVTKIPAYLFCPHQNSNAPKITSVVFEDNSVCKSICKGAFSGCESIEAVYISDLDSWCNISFEDGTANPLRYAKNLYLNKDLVTDLVIPNSVTSIGNYAFYGFTALTSIEIPNSITSIGKYAFYNCTALTSIVIPNSVTSIGEGAFEGCTSLTSIVIPNSVTSIGNHAFYGCTSLTSIEISNSVTSIGVSTFSGCTSLTSIVIPNSVTSIGASAFYGCTSLTSIEISNSVTSIGGCAFEDCTSLTSIVIPNSVTSIGSYAFEDCTALTIYCVAESQPSAWSTYWNNSGCPVYWYSESEPTTNGSFWHYGTNGELVIW